MSDVEQVDSWRVVEAFIEENGLVRQHLDSYDEFVRHGLQQIVDEVGVIEPEGENYYVRLGKIDVGKPTIKEADGSTMSVFPNEARIRNLTYAANLHLEMSIVYRDGDTEEPPVEVYIGRLPIMLKSEKCPLSDLSREELISLGEDPDDPGGYFIINGSERVLVTQEDLAPNRILIEAANKSSSSTHVAKVFSTAQGFRAPVTMERRREGSLRISFPSVPGKIPIVVLMRALGLESDQQIANAIAEEDDVVRELIPSIEAAAEITTRDEALDYVGKRVAVGQTRDYRLKRAEQVLDRYLLPHIGTKHTDRLRKAFYLGQMASHIIELALEKRTEDDKDHYSNKRLKLAGDLLMSLFRVAFLSLTRDIKYQLERNAVRGRRRNIKTAVRADVITDRLHHALATGNWVGGKAGVSQLLDRTNYMSAISHLRRVVSPLSRSQPHFEARDLHPTHWGKICPNETPEGPNCGLVKNLALLAYISVGADEREIESIFVDLGVQPIEEIERGRVKGAQVYLNGRLLGIHSKPLVFVAEVKKRRRSGQINNEVNIAYYSDTNEVQANCDAGRVRRPLIIVENGATKLTSEHVAKLRSKEWKFSDLIRRGVIEFLDAEEEENTYIAMTPQDINEKTTHLEVAPNTILGISASIIPFPEHNQSPRNTYEAGMVKQALGLYAANYRTRADTRAHLLHYPQTPIVNTRATAPTGFDKRPAGQNFIVAVLSYEGYNIEDAIIINKASLERGLGRSTFFRSYEAEERKYPGGQEDKFEIPDRSVRGYRAAEAYRHLSEDGIIEPEVEVQGGEIIIGRTSPPRFLEENAGFELPSQTRRETSTSMRHGETGTVDTVSVTETIDGNCLVKVKIRDQRIPELGDKFATRHGQKGIIGLIVPQEDLPFTEDGVVPDLIVNPHAIPSRMTLGQIIESIAGKVGSLSGKKIDGTAFSGEPLKNLREELKRRGLKYNGREVMYNGITGRKYEADIFIGVVYYQKLHHMVSDKIHARARGPVQILTRQPTEGRAREGGLRFGEMERDCLIGYGASLVLKEKLVEESDKTTTLVCEECGMLAVYDKNKGRYYCPLCGEQDTRVAKVNMSYAFKLLLQELMALGIAPRLKLADKT
ncbi:MAG: DNA-directed RNA polymerase subunit B [Candidatus Jordarchaeum sp.]|uniref:DNA-directed RNA polymerase subunit B n=1 Tax=Candidatus Jordarchaeum sp. TaxID=2823881 RepID=UPI00404974C6